MSTTLELRPADIAPPENAVERPAKKSLPLRDAIRYGAAVASMGAGAIHLTAAAAHGEHRLVFAFFVATGVLQLGWGALVLSKSVPRWIIGAGGLGNALVIGTWVASRITGLPIEGAGHAEPIEVKDAISTLLEVIVVTAAAALLLGARWRSLDLRLPARALTPLAAALAIVMVPGVFLPAHHHSHGSHAHIAAGGHSHDESKQHGHDGDEAGHGDDGHAHGDVAVAGSHEHNRSANHEHTAAEATHAHRAVPPAAAKKAVAPVRTVEGIAKTVRYGPFFLPPASLGGTAHYNRILTNVVKPCTNCYLVHAQPDLVYADGRSANYDSGPMLHHAVWTRPSIPDATCRRNSAIGSQGERFFASGNERTELRLPAGFGYPMGTDSWNLIAELMNHSEQARNVYIQLAVKYVPLSEELSPVRPVWLDVDNCRDSQFAVPAGKSHTVWTWTSNITGRIVSAGGHVHDGGIKTVLRNESTNDEVCTSVAGYGTKPAFEGSIESMSICVWDKIGTVRSGEKLGLHAYYDSSQAQSDVMGIMLLFVYETSDLSGGTAPPDGDEPSEPKPPPVHEH